MKNKSQNGLYQSDIASNTIFDSISQYLNNLNILQSKRFIQCNYYWRLQIEKEIELLWQKKILTSRLAIAIYRATTLKFNDSNTCIGNFYNENLGIKSSSFHLTNIIVKSDIKYVKLKVYHLDKSLLFK